MEDIGKMVENSFNELTTALNEWENKARAKGKIQVEDIAAIRKTIVEHVSEHATVLKVRFSFMTISDEARDEAKKDFEHIFKAALWELKHSPI